MIRILLMLGASFLVGCSSVKLKEESAFLDSYDSEMLYVRIVLSKNRLIPVYSIPGQEIFHYKVIVPRESSFFETPKFHLYVNSQDLEIESGSVAVNDLGDVCELVIDVIPVEKKYMSINGHWKIKNCDGLQH